MSKNIQAVGIFIGFLLSGFVQFVWSLANAISSGVGIMDVYPTYILMTVTGAGVILSLLWYFFVERKQNDQLRDDANQLKEDIVIIKNNTALIPELVLQVRLLVEEIRLDRKERRKWEEKFEKQLTDSITGKPTDNPK